MRTHSGCAATTACMSSVGLDAGNTLMALSPAPVTSLASANMSKRTRTGSHASIFETSSFGASSSAVACQLATSPSLGGFQQCGCQSLSHESSS